MPESVGVQAGRVCPRCGRENSIPLVYGLPGSDLFEQAESGRVALGGCLVMDEQPAFVCRSCDLAWGDESDPTADEAELAGLLDVEYCDVVRALGTGWRRESAADGQDGVRWFVSGEPAQLAVGVQGPWFVLDRPRTSWGDRRPGPLATDGLRFTRDELLHDSWFVGQVAEDVASRRRRSFRWCRTCRRATAPESFVAAEASCQQCVSAFGDADE
ncbi:hypothetical protein QOZ88_17400 [Blastococcus sp. BMG 814]|uniref:Uncharacterized protein n=1 Tax=Blastococcus carthaginiensis TaxID=3050034 RepID=A0ABT9IFQ7_9ACTN|nr:hypothetical protein [Blastococcus carthaginiensis]MDP5184414.1 hypothetical protein [Blastococcus carthaginiensis]